jgi:Rrf2 family iron-sulfur cluster assembly transcriptional regulator
MMVDLVCMSNNQGVTIREIAQRQDVAEPFLSKIATQAANAGLLTSKPGRNGGLALAKSADTITLLQVLEAVDRPITLTRCTSEPSKCPRSNKCAVHPIWEKAQHQLKELMSNTLLSELALAQARIGG